MADPLPVHKIQGTTHGFLLIRSLEGKILGTGDLIEVAHPGRMVSRLVFHFRDGSIDDETATFSQKGVFRLISDHHVQKGPSFPKPIDVMVNASSGQITSRSLDDKGERQVTTEHLDLPPDVCNGLILTLLGSINPQTPETKVSMVIPTVKPRLVKLSIKPGGEESFSIGGVRRKAIDFVIKIELGGLAGVVAPLIGKQPPDFHVWILGGEAPVFIREEGELYEGGPILRIEQTSPAFDRAPAK